MNDFSQAFLKAIQLILNLDPNLIEIVALSLRVSLTAVLIASLIGLPLGAALALYKFFGRGLLVAILNTFMGLPPVVVGLVVYLILSRSGPLGALGLLFTPTAMVIAQVCLITPIIAALTRQTILDANNEFHAQLRALGAKSLSMMNTLLWETRYSLVTNVFAGFGRAIAEVGAVLIVGGNINHNTRVMTTSIALETSKGNIELALALGMILITLSLIVTSAVMSARHAAYNVYS
ncbi:MAG: ABC transporter permease [Gammaproteobacteria bacterium]|nr:ABC transporter permease [Gammaproteobacteria bacterium]